MQKSRRIFIGVALLGLMTVLMVLQPWRDKAPADELPGDTPARAGADDAGTQAPFHSLTSSPGRTASSGTVVRNGSTSRCSNILKQVEDFARQQSSDTQPASHGLAGSASRDDSPSRSTPVLPINAVRADDPGALLTAFLLGGITDGTPPDSASTRSALLDFGTHAASSGSSLLAWHALAACARAGMDCPLTHLEQDLLDAARDNAEAWALVSARRYERGDLAGALRAMQGAARAPTASYHWTDTITLAEQALATHTDTPYKERFANAISAAVTSLPPVSATFRVCRAGSATSQDWAQACLAFATTQARHNRTMIAEPLAQRLRQESFIALGDAAGATEAATRMVLSRAERFGGKLESVVSMGRVETALIESGPEYLRAYLDHVSRLGESAGRRMFFRQHAPALLERAGLLEQDGARECVAQFFEPPAVAGPLAATASHQVQVADQLLVVASGRSEVVRIGPDGMLKPPYGPAIPALGRTTGHLQRELAASQDGSRPGEVHVIALVAPSDEQLRRTFDAARGGITP